jgi:hypothetical protein
MRWLPDRGVGVVALGNTTYAPMDRATLGAIEVLDACGELPTPRPNETNPNLEKAAAVLLALFNDWSDALAGEAFAMNVQLDEDLERRRKHAETLRSSFGPFEAVTLEPISATRASFILHGPRDDVRGSFLLSPESLPRIQTYEVVSGKT